MAEMASVTAGVQLWTTMRIRISWGFVVTLVVFLLCLTALYSRGQDKVTAPKLTAEQKLEIRSAQVALFQTKEVLESTPQFKAFQEAQGHLNETALKVQRE